MRLREEWYLAQGPAEPGAQAGLEPRSQTPGPSGCSVAASPAAESCGTAVTPRGPRKNRMCTLRWECHEICTDSVWKQTRRWRAIIRHLGTDEGPYNRHLLCHTPPFIDPPFLAPLTLWQAEKYSHRYVHILIPRTSACSLALKKGICQCN